MMTQPSSYSGGKRLAKFEIKREENIINAVIEVTKLAEKFGFRRTDMARIATCVSEIGWNILIKGTSPGRVTSSGTLTNLFDQQITIGFSPAFLRDLQSFRTLGSL